MPRLSPRRLQRRLQRLLQLGDPAEDGVPSENDHEEGDRVDPADLKLLQRDRPHAAQCVTAREQANELFFL